MYMIVDIFSFLCAVFLLVTVHELGHFLVAKRLNVKIHCFSIGFGKPLFIYKSKETRYILAAIPLGGYVKMLDSREKLTFDAENTADKARAFDRQPFLSRFAIICAGPLANILFAFIANWAIFIIGAEVPKPIISHVVANSIAAKAGMRSNTELISIDGIPTPDWPSVVLPLISAVGEKNPLIVRTLSLSSNKITTHALNLKDWRLRELNVDPLTSLGIQPYKVFILIKKQYPFILASIPAYKETMNFTKFNFVIVWKMVTGKISLLQLGGPISIFQIANQAFKEGLIHYLTFLSMISISLGCLNILPIPGLDGGHLLFLSINLLRRQTVSLAVESLVTRLGIIFLLVLMCHATVNDISRLFL